MSTVRELIENTDPEHEVYCPLEHCVGGTKIIVYVSDNKDGMGRIGSLVTLWE